jgi:hypothetical protein
LLCASVHRRRQRRGALWLEWYHRFACATVSTATRSFGIITTHSTMSLSAILGSSAIKPRWCSSQHVHPAGLELYTSCGVSSSNGQLLKLAGNGAPFLVTQYKDSLSTLLPLLCFDHALHHCQPMARQISDRGPYHFLRRRAATSVAACAEQSKASAGTDARLLCFSARYVVAGKPSCSLNTSYPSDEVEDMLRLYGKDVNRQSLQESRRR